MNKGEVSLNHAYPKRFRNIPFSGPSSHVYTLQDTQSPKLYLEKTTIKGPGWPVPERPELSEQIQQANAEPVDILPSGTLELQVPILGPH